MSSREFWRLIASKYVDKPDDFVISIGHHELPNPRAPVSFHNLPEFRALTSVTVADVRVWAGEEAA